MEELQIRIRVKNEEKINKVVEAVDHLISQHEEFQSMLSVDQLNEISNIVYSEMSSVFLNQTIDAVER